MPTRNFADVSNNNAQTIDWGQYRRAGHRLVGLKASEGTTFVDSTHASRSESAHKAGVWVAHYHFAHPNVSAVSQARFFWTRLKGHFAPKDFAVVDIETADGCSNSLIAQWVREFNREFTRVSGHSLVGYSGESFLSGIGSCGIKRWWVAKYGPGPASAPSGARVWAWQYTDGQVGPQPHRYAGVGNCDGSLLNRGSYLRLCLSRPH